MAALELITGSYNLKRRISSQKKVIRLKVKLLIEIETNTSIIETTIEIVRQLHDNFDNNTRDGYNYDEIVEIDESEIELSKEREGDEKHGTECSGTVTVRKRSRSRFPKAVIYLGFTS